MSGKKQKKKSVTVPLGDFLGLDKSNAVIVPKQSWAEETEDFEEERFAPPDRIVLPTAPRTAVDEFDPSRIPNDPPYTVYVANLPFDVDDEEISRFFRGLNIKSIRMPKDSVEGGRPKGFGYVELESRNDLVEALSKNNDIMRNRPIRVDIAEGEGGGGQRSRGGFDRMGGGGRDRDEEQEDRSGGVSDWRAAPRSDAPPRESGGGGFRSGREDRSPGRGSGGFEDRSRDGYGDRRQGGDRYGDRAGGGGFRDRFQDRDRGGDRMGSGGDRFEDRRSGGRLEVGSEDRWRPREPPSRGGETHSSRDEPKERPRLNLQPRSAGKSAEDSSGVLAPDGGAAPSANPSIFGGARPVDTAGREKAIEEKLMHPHKESHREIPHRDATHREPSGTGGTPPKAATINAVVVLKREAVDIFGAAKPVDTASKEREIEEKLRKGHDDPKRDDHDGSRRVIRLDPARDRDRRSDDKSREGRDNRDYRDRGFGDHDKREDRGFGERDRRDVRGFSDRGGDRDRGFTDRERGYSSRGGDRDRGHQGRDGERDRGYNDRGSDRDRGYNDRGGDRHDNRRSPERERKLSDNRDRKNDLVDERMKSRSPVNRRNSREEDEGGKSPHGGYSKDRDAKSHHEIGGGEDAANERKKHEAEEEFRRRKDEDVEVEARLGKQLKPVVLDTTNKFAFLPDEDEQ